METAMRHPTTRVETNDMTVKQEQLKNDLSELDGVEWARKQNTSPRGVMFKVVSDDYLPRIGPEIMSVLADHGAELPFHQQRTTGEYTAIIES